MPVPNLFFSGETAGTSAALNANFAYILGLVQALGSNSVGSASGGSVALGRSTFTNSTIATASGTCLVVATGLALQNNSSLGTATGTSSADSNSGSSQNSATGTATGGSQAAGLVGGAGVGIGTATVGSATALAIGSSQAQSPGAILGTSVDTGLSNVGKYAVGVATGSSTAVGAGPTQIESPNASFATLPTQTITASTTPGSAGSSFTTFILPSTGIVTVNGVSDTSTSAVVELYYAGHVLFKQQNTGQWARWTNSFTVPNAGNWQAVASPLPVVNTESPEGTIVSTVGQTIFASTTPGSAAGATLNTFTLSANPGSVVQNGGTDAGTTNVTQLFYHNHQLFILRGTLWSSWNSAATTTTGNYSAGSATSPIPQTDLISIGIIQNELVNTTYVVSGTLEGYSTTGSGLNLLANSTPTNGAAAGSPGILPTGWSSYLGGGTVAQTIVGVGTDATTGFPYIDWRVVGVPTDTQAYILFGIGIPVTASTTYTESCYVARIASGGTLPGPVIQFDEFNASGYITSDSGPFLNLTATPVVSSMTGTVGATTTTVNAGFVLQFAAGQNLNVTYRLCGMQFQTGATATTFSQTPAPSAAPPTLQYQDAGTTTWLPFPSTNAVTNTSWSFVHPPLTSVPLISPFFTAIRDANATSVMTVSNNYQVFTSGVTTLQSITYTPPAGLAASSPAGTAAGTIAVAVSPGSFTGSVTVGSQSPANSFTTPVIAVGGVLTLQTASILPAGTYSFVLTASQSGASPSTLSTGVQTINITAESTPGTAVTAANVTILASSIPGTAVGTGGAVVNTIFFTAGGTISVNGVVTGGAGVTQLYYVGHTCYQFNGTSWFGPITAGVGNTGGSASDPRVTIALDGQIGGTVTFAATTGASASELVGSPGTVVVNAGGTNNITLTLTGTIADFSFSQSGPLTTISSNNVVGPFTTQLWTVAGIAMPTGNTFPLTITATLT